MRTGRLLRACRFLVTQRLLALPAVLGMVIVGVCPGIASAAPVGHVRPGPPAVPGAGLGLARAPAGLRAAVGRTLGVPATAATGASQQAKLTAADAAVNDYFGLSVAIYGSTAVVGAPYKNTGTAAYVFVRSGSAWSQQAKLTAADSTSGDLFGSSVAIYGSTVLVGAPGANSFTGAAYVFARSGTAWSQQAKLTAASGGEFGWSVALYGSTAVVSAPYENSQTGAAYVFARSGTAWSQQAILTAAHGAPSDRFGWSVAIYGSTAVVGAPYRKSGTAYVFARSGTAWSQQAQLAATDGAVGGLFGSSVAIYGSTALVSAPHENSDTGAAYVFARSGTAWSQQAKLTARGTSGESLGWSVAIYGSTAVLGAPSNQFDTGAAYVFARSGTAWSQQAKLTAADAASSDDFGGSVALYGSTAIAGAPYKNSNTGAAYVFVSV